MRYADKDYNNKAFYNSKAWRTVSAAYMSSKYYICERCGRPATICHHKQWLNGSNVNDPAIALGFDNLEALCMDCHNAEHSLKHSVTLFNDDGTVATVKENQAAKDFNKTRNDIDELLEKLGKLNNCRVGGQD